MESARPTRDVMKAVLIDAIPFSPLFARTLDGTKNIYDFHEYLPTSLSVNGLKVYMDADGRFLKYGITLFDVATVASVIAFTGGETTGVAMLMVGLDLALKGYSSGAVARDAFQNDFWVEESAF